VQTDNDKFDWLVDVDDIPQWFWDWSHLLVVHLDAPMIIHQHVSGSDFQVCYKLVSTEILCPVVTPELLSFKKLLNSTHFPMTSPKSAYTNKDIIEFVWQKIRLLQAWRQLKVLRQLVEANLKSLDDQKSPDGQPLSGKDSISKWKKNQPLFKNVTETLLAKLREAGSPDDPYFTLLSSVIAVNDHTSHIQQREKHLTYGSMLGWTKHRRSWNKFTYYRINLLNSSMSSKICCPMSIRKGFSTLVSIP
jgi:hypothetical protein